MKVFIQSAPGVKGAQAKTRAIAGAALKTLGLAEKEVSILLADNEAIKELNKKYRKIAKPTDVLSFPMEDDELLGDIVISVEKTKEQAAAFGVSFEEELSRLIIHGLLHLMGYDHVKGGRQAAKMKGMEEEVMGALRKKGLFKGAPTRHG